MSLFGLVIFKINVLWKGKKFPITEDCRVTLLTDRVKIEENNIFVCPSQLWLLVEWSDSSVPCPSSSSSPTAWRRRMKEATSWETPSFLQQLITRRRPRSSTPEPTHRDNLRWMDSVSCQSGQEKQTDL